MIKTTLSISYKYFSEKNYHKSILFCLCVFLFSGFSLAAVPDASLMAIGAYSENKKEIEVYQKGWARLMHSSVFENMGYRLTLINQPYLRNLQLANAGQLDGTVMFKLDKDVDLYGRELHLSTSTKPHIATELVLYTNKGNAAAVLKDITNVSIGSMRSLPGADEYFNSIDIEPHMFKDYTSLFNVLRAGRVDAILVPRFIYELFVYENYIQDKYEYVKSFGCLEGYIAFSVAKFGRRKADALAQEHGKTISKLREMKSDIFYFDC